MVNSQKMAKKLGNIIAVRQLLEEGRDAKAVRYALASAHYKTQMNFTYQVLDSAKETVDSINALAAKIKFLLNKVPDDMKSDKILKYLDDVTRDFEKHMDDNLDTPQTLAVIHEMIGVINKQIDKKQVDKKV